MSKEIIGYWNSKLISNFFVACHGLVVKSDTGLKIWCF